MDAAVDSPERLRLSRTELLARTCLGAAEFLVYMALVRTGLDDVRHDLAVKSEKLFLKEWVEHRHVHENYSSITGEGCDSGSSDKFYHWGALLCAIALAEAGYIKDFGKALEL